jgi:hypothetical protein
VRPATSQARAGGVEADVPGFSNSETLGGSAWPVVKLWMEPLLVPANLDACI